MTRLAPVLAMITPQGVTRYPSGTTPHPTRERQAPGWALPPEGRTAVTVTAGQLQRGDRVTLPLLTYTTGQTDTVTGTVVLVQELSAAEKDAGPCDIAVHLAEYDWEVQAEASRAVTVLR